MPTETLQLIFPHIVAFSAALSRIVGMFLFAPALGGNAAPIQVRVLMILALAAIIYPSVSAHASPDLVRLDILSLAPMLAGELLVGLSIGTIASLPLISVQSAGTIMSHKMGLRLGDTFNPAINLGSDAFGQLLFYLAIVAFLNMGGAEAMIGSVVDSFGRIPIGGAGLGLAPLDLVVGLAASGLDIALRISAPVLTVLFLEMIASGLIMKTMPQLNILSFGFAIKIIVGLLALAGSIAVIQIVIQTDVGDSIDMMVSWARGVMSGG